MMDNAPVFIDDPDQLEALVFLRKQIKKTSIALFRAENKVNAATEIKNLNAKMNALNYLADLVLSKGPNSR